MLGWPNCPECGKKAEFLSDSAPIYNGRNHGPLYVCTPCDTRVGCHKNSTIPLGSMAGKRLRQVRQDTHDAFDPIWKDECWPKGENAPKKRTAAYKWLAGRMGIDEVAECHIGWFDEEQCKRAIHFSKRYLSNWERRKRQKARKEAEWD